MSVSELEIQRWEDDGGSIPFAPRASVSRIVLGRKSDELQCTEDTSEISSRVYNRNASYNRLISEVNPQTTTSLTRRLHGPR
jgi:hypothetical protein